MSGLSHFDHDGNTHMVDVSKKDHSERVAVAIGCIKMQAQAYEIISKGGAKKGDVLGVARLAGIMGAKKTPDLIPLCHPLFLSKISVEMRLLIDQIKEQVQQTVQEKIR